jgi:hypothetical protein
LDKTLWIGSHLSHHGNERSLIPSREEAAMHAVSDELADAAIVRSDYWRAHAHRFHEYITKGFLVCRENEDVGLTELTKQFRNGK